jgi:hypothetical protein
LIWAWPSRAQQKSLEPEPPAITTIPSDGLNMIVVEQINPYYVITTLDPPVFDWFAGTFTNLPTDKEVTIGLNMAGMDSLRNNADVSKWVGLKPVYTYADPTQYEAYEWFQKDAEGRWISGDPFKTGDAKYAGFGKVPIQHIIPDDLAEEFLSRDGKYWQPWHDVNETEVITNINIFRIKQKFHHKTATVAMRVPYAYTYLQSLIQHLGMAKIPGINIEEIGITAEKRKIQVIRINSQLSYTDNIDKRRTVLLIAREHATEHDSSWIVTGALSAILNNSSVNVDLRKNITWLIIPI